MPVSPSAERVSRPVATALGEAFQLLHRILKRRIGAAGRSERRPAAAARRRLGPRHQGCRDRPGPVNAMMRAVPRKRGSMRLFHNGSHSRIPAVLISSEPMTSLG
ncbi:MAG: hypothetical protein JWN05_1413 [Arthrobacter sp.]|nr:hypothetical protein [Arthrobacter sp.]